jgi:hypothetical protein
MTFTSEKVLRLKELPSVLYPYHVVLYVFEQLYIAENTEVEAIDM